MKRKIDCYRELAMGNNEKTKLGEFQDGMFILGTCPNNKLNGIRDVARYWEDWDPNEGKGRFGDAILQVQEVIIVDEDFDLLNGWLSRLAPDHRGGSQSDDVDENKPADEYTPEDYETFYQLVTVYYRPDGRWIAVDAQGSDYWRYVYLPNYFCSDDMFGRELRDAVDELESERDEEHRKKQEMLDEHKANYADLLAHLRQSYADRGITLADNTSTKSIKSNLLKTIKSEFNNSKDVDVTVKGHTGYYRRFWITIDTHGSDELREKAESIKKFVQTEDHTGVWISEYNDQMGYREYEETRSLFFDAVGVQPSDYVDWTIK